MLSGVEAADDGGRAIAGSRYDERVDDAVSNGAASCKSWLICFAIQLSS